MKTALSAAAFLGIAALNIAAIGGAGASPLLLTIDINGDIQTFNETSPNQILLPVETFAGGVVVSGEIATAVPGTQNTLSSSALSIQNNLGVVATVSAVLSGMNFVGPSNFVAFSSSGTWLNTPGSVMSQTWYDDPDNGLGGHFVGDTPGNIVGTFVSGASAGTTDSFAYSPGELVLGIPDTGAFSMTEAWNYTLAAGGTLQSRGQTEVKLPAEVPEPAGFLLIGSGLFALGLMRRRDSPVSRRTSG